LSAPCVEPERLRAIVRRDTPSRLGVEEMIRVCLAADADDFIVAPLPRGAGSVTTLVRADGILRIPASCEGIPAGAAVDIELLRPRSEIGRAIVVAGAPHPLFAELEDASRRASAFIRFAYLGLSGLDAVSALATGESHCALFHDDAASGLTREREMLTERISGWRGYELRGNGTDRSLLALTPRFAAGALCRAFDGVAEAARDSGLELTSIESAGAHS